MYDTLVLYLAVFPENEVLRKDPLSDPRWESWPILPPSSILSQWANSNIKRLLDSIQRADMKSAIDFSTIWSKLMTMAASFGRMGIDFRPIVTQKLTKIIEKRFRISVQVATNRLTQSSQDIVMIGIDPSSLPQFETSPDSPPVPSAELSLWDDLTIYANFIVDALNGLRFILSPILISTVVSSLRDSIRSILSWLSSSHSNSANFSRAIRIVCTCLAPFFEKCVAFFFPPKVVMQIFGSSISKEQYLQIIEFDIEKLAASCDSAEKIEEIVKPLLTKKSLADFDLDQVLMKKKKPDFFLDQNEEISGNQAEIQIQKPNQNLPAISESHEEHHNEHHMESSESHENLRSKIIVPGEGSTQNSGYSESAESLVKSSESQESVEVPVVTTISQESDKDNQIESLESKVYENQKKNVELPTKCYDVEEDLSSKTSELPVQPQKIEKVQEEKTSESSEATDVQVGYLEPIEDTPKFEEENLWKDSEDLVLPAIPSESEETQAETEDLEIHENPVTPSESHEKTAEFSAEENPWKEFEVQVTPSQSEETQADSEDLEHPVKISESQENPIQIQVEKISWKDFDVPVTPSQSDETQADSEVPENPIQPSESQETQEESEIQDKQDAENQEGWGWGEEETQRNEEESEEWGWGEDGEIEENIEEDETEIPAEIPAKTKKSGKDD
ncbi:unnamed protein product [Caenorhabditis angaria]|uniref:Conserved oligomeric Golgi complex subunit 8 n=1 Tax=Caenorhabditis angaria TaxID=860376 RepID=A0A9P1IN10_9PELO|nr:unnamed protein product [Caenorhabditis angaria]